MALFYERVEISTVQVSAELSTEDNCVTVLEATGFPNYGDIPAGEVSTMRSGSYKLEISESCPGGSDIPIHLSIASDGYFFWADSFSIQVALGIADKSDFLPETFALHQNYPNPFNPTTTLRYDLPERSEVTLTIYDILGREVRNIVYGIEEPGFKSVVWDGTDELGRQVSAGVYLYQIKARQPFRGGQAGDYIQTRKMILLR